MITCDAELDAAQGKVRVIEALLAHTRRMMPQEDFELHAKGWLREWDRLEADIREYLSTPEAAPALEMAPAA